ncbi:MAG: hypothetical protein ACJAYE_002862 [Candidatus Azotimanducaceae bacterium]|jgi:hypothetical protein
MAPDELMALNARYGSIGGLMKYRHLGLALVDFFLEIFTQPLHGMHACIEPVEG